MFGRLNLGQLSTVSRNGESDGALLSIRDLWASDDGDALGQDSSRFDAIFGIQPDDSEPLLSVRDLWADDTVDDEKYHQEQAFDELFP